MTVSLTIWLLIFVCCFVAGLLAWAVCLVARKADEDAGIDDETAQWAELNTPSEYVTRVKSNHITTEKELHDFYR